MVQTNERTSNECNIHNGMKTRQGKPTVPYNKILPNIYLHKTKCEGCNYGGPRNQLKASSTKMKTTSVDQREIYGTATRL